MDTLGSTPAWDDPSWLERSDTSWRAMLRLQQAWWREVRLGLPPGPILVKGGRAVVSMLPVDVSYQPNIMTDEAEQSVHEAKASLRGRPGLIQDDRLRRNLLSSQPLCFNLFGHLAHTPDALLPWVQTLVPRATAVTAVRLEWAPREGTIGGSAFDAFVELALDGQGKRGFLGIECKYAEDLRASQRSKAAEKYRERTTPDHWRVEAPDNLDQTGLRQLWYNQLLTQAAAGSGYETGVGVVVACRDDVPARQAVERVRQQLLRPDELRFEAIESVVDSIFGHDSWRANFAERYLEFDVARKRLHQMREKR